MRRSRDQLSRVFHDEFQSRLRADLRAVFLRLDTPFAVQEYLDSMPYIGEERDRSPLNVMLDGQCHCLDGGFLAALALWQIGFKPLLIDIVPEPGKDDDHVLALYQIEDAGEPWQRPITLISDSVSLFIGICVSW